MPTRGTGCAAWLVDEHYAAVPHLQTYLGHADVRSTRRYARLANSALIQVLRPAKATPAEADLSHTCPACEFLIGRPSPPLAASRSSGATRS